MDKVLDDLILRSPDISLVLNWIQNNRTWVLDFELKDQLVSQLVLALSYGKWTVDHLQPRLCWAILPAVRERKLGYFPDHPSRCKASLFF